MNSSVFQQFPIISTNRLILRALNAADKNEVAELMYNNPNKTPLELIEELKLNFGAKKGLNWGVQFNNEIIGTCGYYRGFENNTGEIGFVMREKFRRKGFTQEAVEAIIQFGFNNLNLDKITAYTKSENTPCIQLLCQLKF